MSEVGTLKELNVQPGDVVMGSASGKKYTIALDESGRRCDDSDMNALNENHRFTLISRASPAIDLTTNTSAWGLCSDEWQAAMRAHMNAGGEYEWYCANGTWSKRNTPLNDPPLYGIYRAKPGPVVTTRVNASWLYCHDGGDSSLYRTDGPSHIPGTLTTTLHDGKPVKAKWVAK